MEEKKHKIIVGRYTYGHNLISVGWWGENAKLIIGSFCSIAKCTILLGGNHNTNWVTTYPFGHIHCNTFNKCCGKGHPKTNGDVIIKNDVWIGQNATILSGVTIGNGAVIACNSHVVRDVKDYEIVGGNPANHIKFRFNEDIREKLLKIKWWDWDIERINKFSSFLCSSGLETFFQKIEEF